MAQSVYASFEEQVHRGLHLVPDHLQEGVQEHCLIGRPTGDFLTACLSNDLLDAVARGDDRSLAGLKGIMQFFYNYAPPGCWGSRQKVEDWRARRGLLAELESGNAA